MSATSTTEAPHASWPRWFARSSRDRMTADEIAAWVAEVEPDPDAHRTPHETALEVQCPCCERSFPLADLRGHVEEPPAWCDRERWGAIVGSDETTPGEAADCGFLEVRPFDETAERRVWELELLVSDLRFAVADLAERVNGKRWAPDLMLPPLPTVGATAGHTAPCSSCAAAYPDVAAGHHEWLLSFEERGVAGCVELLALFDAQASNGGAEDGEVPWVEFRDWAARHHWTDPAAVADFGGQVENVCRLRETASQAAVGGTGRS